MNAPNVILSVLTIPKTCGKLSKPPYVCNSCCSVGSCPYYRLIYIAKYADDCYRELLSSSREGINQSPEEMQKLDMLISPLIIKGQSLAHIYANHAKEISCSRRTLYKYINKNVFTARNIDLPRKVKYKVRKSSTGKTPFDREYCRNRTYKDFGELLLKNPTLSVVEMDTVEGTKGGKVFDYLTKALGLKNFRNLFQVILTDRGSEFQTPHMLEYTSSEKKRTSIYYCDPQCSWQKGMIEKNHEFIRYVVPKGNSFDTYNQKQISNLMNHINSTARDNLNSFSPYQLSRMLLDNFLCKELSLHEIHYDDVMLKPALLKH